MNHYKLSEDFLHKLFSISAGYLPAEVVDSFLRLIEAETGRHHFTYSSESNLLRIIQGMYDKTSFISDAVQYPHYIEILTAIAANSNYLTDILVRNPEYFYRIVNPSHLNRSYSNEELQTIVESTVLNYKSLSGKINSLRSLKRREILITGLRDILHISDIKATTTELSALANQISAALFKICYKEILLKYKLKNVNNKYCIISLGKLGGNELNYSSDIDLIMFYDKDSRYGRKEYKELLTEAIYLFIEQSSSITSSGYIYRVDFRLRPDGRNAPLCSTINDYLNYYESRGEDWERQMLIKAGFHSGDKELFNKFITYLQPFIYPDSFRISPVEQIKKLKRNIENSLPDNQNIKLSSGGIRDIEFSVQALQLINGSGNRNLRTGNTIDALDALHTAGLISGKEYSTIYKTYVLYRKIEHYLQLMNDLQTHSIPTTGEILPKLSAYLNYPDEKSFLSDIVTRRAEVSAFFNSVTGNTAASTQMVIKFRNSVKAEKDFLYLREGKGLLGTREFDMQSIKSFTTIEPTLIKYLSGSSNPDLVLQNFVRVIRTAGFPSIWYRSFQDKKLFNNYLKILEYSKRAVDLFSENASLQEFFLSGLVFEKLSNDKIKTFTVLKFIFTLSVQFCLQIINADKLSLLLSNYFRFRIDQIASEYLPKTVYMIAAMGSLGTKEMSFASDIDLIFVTGDNHESSDQQKLFQKFLKILKEEFKPFETDCRLRPEGKSSQLAWDINSYLNYIDKRARIWELQSFCKLDFITGDKQLYKKLISGIEERIRRESCTAVKRGIMDMRKQLYPADLSGVAKIFNVKKSAGGITDIEFLLQYLILCNPDLYSKYRGKNIPGVLKQINNLISEEDSALLIDSIGLLHMTDVSNQNIFNVSMHSLPAEAIKQETLAEFLKYESAGEYLSAVRNSSRNIRQLYEKYLNK